ncbi:hypothetical protein GCM10022243_32660 [Saccharothrix violaceirubra]
MGTAALPRPARGCGEFVQVAHSVNPLGSNGLCRVDVYGRFVRAEVSTPVHGTGAKWTGLY